jgi:mRNA-degrading endonuclease toxin of MazEF toxin-antitoxin module
MNREMRTGDIWLLKIGEKSRPCFIIKDLGVKVEVLILTSKSLDNLGFTHIVLEEIDGLIPKSKVLCEAYSKMNKKDILNKICECPEEKMSEILKKIRICKQLDPDECNVIRV